MKNILEKWKTANIWKFCSTISESMVEALLFFSCTSVIMQLFTPFYVWTRSKFTKRQIVFLNLTNTKWDYGRSGSPVFWIFICFSYLRMESWRKFHNRTEGQNDYCQFPAFCKTHSKCNEKGSHHLNKHCIFFPIPSLILEMSLKNPSCERCLPQGLPQNQTCGSDLCTGLGLSILWSLPTDRGGKASEERNKDEQENCGRKKRHQVANQVGLVAKWELGSARGQWGVKDVGTEEEYKQPGTDWY